MFYNAFGVAPEEVGLGPADTGVRSALALLIGLLPAAALVAFISVFQYGMARRIEAQARAVGLTPAQIFELVLWTKPADREGYLSGLGIGGENQQKLIRQAALFDTGVFGSDILRRSMRPFVGFTLSLYSTKAAVWWAITYGCGLAVVALIILNAVAANSANEVKSGHDGHVALGNLQLLPWGAERVDVAAKTDLGRKFDSTECFMYLGQSNGTTVLYAVRTNETIRVSSSAVVLTTILNRRECA